MMEYSADADRVTQYICDRAATRAEHMGWNDAVMDFLATADESLYTHLVDKEPSTIAILEYYNSKPGRKALL